MTTFAAFALGCLSVSPNSDRILAGDLAAAFPALQGVAADTVIALAPEPGVQRVFHVPELRRLAIRLNLPQPPDADICIERPAFPLDPANLLAAMQRELPAARMEILEYSRQKAPAGEIGFSAALLRPGLTDSFWPGWVCYGGGRRFPIWVRARILTPVTRVTPSTALPAGRQIEATQLRLESREEPLTATAFAERIDQVAGKCPRVPIPAGTAVRISLLDNPKEVLRGQTVRVDVRNGGAHLQMEALAEGAGARGETIPVRNPVSQRRFLARVEGKGRVSVDRPVKEDQ